MKNNIQNPDESNRSFKEVSTKLTPQTFLLVSRLCATRNIRIYNLLQMACECFARMMSDKYGLTPEMQRLMAVFENLQGWKNAFSMAEPDVNRMIGEAIYFLYDADGQRKGTAAIHVRRPLQGEWDSHMDGMPGWEETRNIQYILERLMCLIFPQRYERLRRTASSLGLTSQLELLDYIVDYFAKVEDDRELAAPFEDAMRAENGRAIKYGDRTRRKKRTTLDMFEQRRNENENENE